MDPSNTPKRKMTRFSQHPQIFQYSSKNKKQSGDLDDSLLLDDNYENDVDTISQENQQKLQKSTSSINFDQKRFQLDQLTSQLAQIQQYLNSEDDPPINPLENLTPLKKQQPHRISFGMDNRSRLSFNVKNQLKSGRETMNIQEETKVKSQLKNIVESYQKNKEKNYNLATSLQQESKDKTIQEKIKQQVQRKNRITMDTNSLINMINSYDRQQSERKYRQSRQNRITLDVFTLSKMVENIEIQNKEASDQIITQQIENQNMVTPVKNNRETFFQKPTIFSAYKHNASQSQTHLEITKYLEEVDQRIAIKNEESIRLQEQLNYIKSQTAKSQIRISNTEKNIEKTKKNITDKLQYKQKLKKILEESNYDKDLQAISQLEAKYQIQVIKYEKKKIEEDNFYCRIGVAHVNLSGFYAKIKSKNYQSIRNNQPTPPNTIDLKLMYSRQIKQCTQTFLFSLDDMVRICKKYHYKYLSGSNTNNQHAKLLRISLQLKKILQNITTLDMDLQYLSLNFQSQTFELNSSRDMLNFKVNWAIHFSVLFQINILTYLHDMYDLETVRVYDLKNHGYLNLDLNVSELRQKQESILFESLKQLVKRFC